MSLLHYRLEKRDRARRICDETKEWAQLVSAFGDPDRVTLAAQAVEYATEQLIRCEKAVARSENRAYWKERVFTELYENKVLVEEYETPEHALLRFLLDFDKE
jgi:hypothetical protein